MNHFTSYPFWINEIACWSDLKSLNGPVGIENRGVAVFTHRDITQLIESTFYFLTLSSFKIHTEESFSFSLNKNKIFWPFVMQSRNIMLWLIPKTSTLAKRKVSWWAKKRWIFQSQFRGSRGKSYLFDIFFRDSKGLNIIFWYFEDRRQKGISHKIVSYNSNPVLFYKTESNNWIVKLAHSFYYIFVTMPFYKGMYNISMLCQSFSPCKCILEDICSLIHTILKNSSTFSLEVSDWDQIEICTI